MLIAHLAGSGVVVLLIGVSVVTERRLRVRLRGLSIAEREQAAWRWVLVEAARGSIAMPLSVWLWNVGPSGASTEPFLIIECAVSVFAWICLTLVNARWGSRLLVEESQDGAEQSSEGR